MAKLGELGKIITGNTPKTSDAQNYESNDICFVKPSDFTDNEITEIYQSEFYISAYAKDKARVLPTDSILVTCIGIIGKVAINKVPCAFNQQINAIVPEKKVCNPRYIAYAIQNLQPKMQSTANAAVVPILNKTQFSNLEVPLLPVGEQKQIACNLNKIDKLIFLRKQQLAKLDELVKARFVEMFGDAKLNPYDFPCNSLSEYILFLTSGSRGWSQYFTDGGEYFITIKNVKNCRITLQDVQYVMPPDNAEAKRTKVQENDLLISITADLGRTGVVPKEIAKHGAYINQHLICIRLNLEKVNPIYVAYYMESAAGKEQFASKNQSAVKAGLNFNSINSLKLVVPPLDLQNDFAAFVARVDQQKQTVQQSLEKLELMKKALMQEYFG